MKSKILLTIAVVILLLVAAVPYCIKTAIRHSGFYRERIASRPVDRKVTNPGKAGKIGEGTNEITVLYLKGTPYEMGFQHGRLLKEDIRSCINGVLDACADFIRKEARPVPGKAAAGFLLDEAYKKMEPYIPNDCKEEMQGLADGSGVPLEDIHRVHALPELTETTCSAFVAFGKATKDGNLYQLRILDYIMELGVQDHPVIMVYHPDEGNTFANISWAGFTGVVSGMNNKGIAVSEMGYGGPKEELPGIPSPGPEETLEGLPMIFLLKKVLQHAENVEQAAGIMKGADRTSYYVYMTGDGITEDGGKEARAFISTKDFCSVYAPNKGNYPIPQIEDVVYGSHYNEKCYELLKQYYGQVDPHVTMEKIIPAIAMKGNLQCVVYDPGNLRLWVANAEGQRGRACEQEYVLFDLGKTLN